jgi:hypothetical protein
VETASSSALLTSYTTTPLATAKTAVLESNPALAVSSLA